MKRSWSIDWLQISSVLLSLIGSLLLMMSVKFVDPFFEWQKFGVSGGGVTFGVVEQNGRQVAGSKLLIPAPRPWLIRFGAGGLMAGSCLQLLSIIRSRKNQGEKKDT